MMLLPSFYAFPVFTASISNQALEEEEPQDSDMNSESARKLYNDYRELIKDYFSIHGLSEWTGQMTSDPWSPSLHYIIRSEERRILGLIKYLRNVAVAEITSEPQFAKNYMEEQGLRYDGLEIKVLDRGFEPVIDGFLGEYAKRFGEKGVLVQDYKRESSNKDCKDNGQAVP